MQDASDESSKRGLKGRAILLVVGLGMVLFVVGFAMTVTSLSDPESVSAQGDYEMSETGSGSTSDSMLLMTGLLLSLAGVVMATTGPAVFFLRKQKGAS